MTIAQDHTSGICGRYSVRSSSSPEVPRVTWRQASHGQSESNAQTPSRVYNVKGKSLAGMSYRLLLSRLAMERSNIKVKLPVLAIRIIILEVSNQIYYYYVSNNVDHSVSVN